MIGFGLLSGKASVAVRLPDSTFLLTGLLLSRKRYGEGSRREGSLLSAQWRDFSRRLTRGSVSVGPLLPVRSGVKELLP